MEAREIEYFGGQDNAEGEQEGSIHSAGQGVSSRCVMNLLWRLCISVELSKCPAAVRAVAQAPVAG